MGRLIKIRCFIALIVLALLAACAPSVPSTPFIPPAPQILTSSTPSPTPTRAVIETPDFISASPTATLPSTAEPTAETCTNNLTYDQDLTIPDGSIIQPGASIEKEWLVTNSGSCNWEASYRLRLVSGEPLGAPIEQALYPSKAGAQATLRIIFTAPLIAGTYQSAWQAFSPDGAAFGDAIYMTINISP